MDVMVELGVMVMGCRNSHEEEDDSEVLVMHGVLLKSNDKGGGCVEEILLACVKEGRRSLGLGARRVLRTQALSAKGRGLPRCCVCLLTSKRREARRGSPRPGEMENEEEEDLGFI